MSSFNFLNKFANNIKELLKKPNVTLDEVLEENEIANEYKEQKEYVLKFFQEKEFQTLLKYLNKDHPKLDEKKKAYKFPLTSSEIFATASPQVLEFFQQKNKGSLNNFQSLFEEFFDKDGKIKKDTINYTRVGYVWRVLQALISKEPQIFAQEIYDNNKFFKALLKHSYCLSVVNILSCLIFGVQNDDNQEENKGETKKNDEWLKKTNQYRVLYFQEIVGQTLGTSNNQELYQINKNLGQLISKVLKTVFVEKEQFLKIFYDENFLEFGQNFLDSFFENQNQISGNIFNIGLQYILDNEKQTFFEIDKLEKISQKFFKVLNTYCQKSQSQSSTKKATTFNKEVSIPSNKIYKFVNSILKQVQLYIKNEKYEIIENKEFAQSIFHLYSTHPYNNILHYKITQILQQIINTKKQNLIDIFFFKNQAFQHIINQVVSDYKILQENKSELKSCYFGFIKNLQEDLQSAGFDNKDQNTTYESFLQEFVEIEANKEQSIFKEIDSNTQGQQYEVEYDFSIDQIHDRYCEFLGLAERSKKEDVQEEQEEEEIEEAVDVEDMQKEQEEEEEGIKSQELREELKNVMDQEETAYHDLKFWKNENYYEIEALMNELNK